MLHKVLTSLHRRWRSRPLGAKLLIPSLVLVLLLLLGSTLTFIGGTALTRNQLLRQQITADAERVTEAMDARVSTVVIAASLLASDPNVIEATPVDSEIALSVLNDRAVVVRDRFDLDMVQIYDERGEGRTNLVLSTLYRESSLLDLVDAGIPTVKIVKDRMLLLGRAEMPAGAGSVIAAIDLEAELNRIASRYRLLADLGLSVDDLNVGTSDDIPFDAPDGRTGDYYSRHRTLMLGETPVDLLLVRPTTDITRVSRTGLMVMMGSMLLMTLLLVGLGAITIRSIIQPVQRLSAAAEAVAGGDLSQRVEIIDLPSPLGIGQEDEIGLLAMTFNDMVADLRSLYEGLESKVQARTREIATAAEVARAVSSTLDLDVVLQTSVRLIEKQLGFYYVGIFTIKRGSNIAVMGEATGDIGRLLKAQEFRIPVGSKSLVGMAADTHCPCVVQDVSVDPMYLEVPLLPNTRSEAAIPLVVGKAVVGVLDVQSTQCNAFPPGTVKLLMTLADQIAIGVQNAQLYAQQRQHAQDLEMRVRDRTAQLRAQYARLEAVLNSASEGIIVANRHGDIIQTNPVVEGWLNQTLLPEDRARLRSAVRDLAQRAKEWPEVVLELPGLDLELQAAPISEPSVGEAASVVVVHDISHLKALDRMKSRFVSNVSHELRTPVTTIKLYAALMQRTKPEDERWAEYLDALANEADRQARLVEDILHISRVDTGRLSLKPRIVSLDELVELVCESHKVLAQGRGLVLEHGHGDASARGAAESSDEPPLTLVDADRMMQVLNNLVENAIQYTLEGGRVAVSTGKEKAGGQVWATATVSDTGIGIPKDELPHIFERFFRGEKPRTMQLPGTGLGLAIVKEIVGLHGGRVTVQSKVGEGSAFTVWLPLADGRGSSPDHRIGLRGRFGADVEEADAVVSLEGGYAS